MCGYSCCSSGIAAAASDTASLCACTPTLPRSVYPFNQAYAASCMPVSRQQLLLLSQLQSCISSKWLLAAVHQPHMFVTPHRGCETAGVVISLWHAYQHSICSSAAV